MITAAQEKIYNEYLKALGHIKGRGYKQRKNFSKIDDRMAMILYRLEVFFSTYPDINPFNFFLAAMKYKNTDFLPLETYIKHGAVIAYMRVFGNNDQETRTSI
jgi:hypothetical protein